MESEDTLTFDEIKSVFENLLTVWGKVSRPQGQPFYIWNFSNAVPNLESLMQFVFLLFWYIPNPFSFGSVPVLAHH